MYGPSNYTLVQQDGTVQQSSPSDILPVFYLNIQKHFWAITEGKI